MKLYQKLITSFFFSLGGILLFSTHITAADDHELMFPLYENEAEVHQSFKSETKKHDHYVNKQKGSPKLYEMVVAESKKRLNETLPALNPFWFLVSFIITFPLTYFLLDTVLVELQVKNKIENQNKWNAFVAQAILFYIINSIKKIVHISLLKILLQPFERFSKIYSLILIVITTSFMSICILTHWFLGLALLIVLVITASVWMPSKKTDKNAYLLTNILFVIITWLSIRGVWYISTETSLLDKILTCCHIETNDKKNGIRPLLLSSGNLNIVTLWHQLKDIIYFRDISSTSVAKYTTLGNAVKKSKEGLMFYWVFEKINGWPDIFKYTIYASFQNIIFEHARDWLL